MKELVELLRSLPVLEPPGDFTRRVMNSLPGPRPGLAGAAALEPNPDHTTGRWRGANLLLPASPTELGLSLFGAGVLFLGLAPVALLGLHRAGLAQDLGHWLLFLAPALIGAVLLVLAGWTQLASPRAIIAQQPRLALVGFLFGLTLVLGRGLDMHQVMAMIATWLGFSGLIITGGLSLVPILLTTNREVCHAKYS